MTPTQNFDYNFPHFPPPPPPQPHYPPPLPPKAAPPLSPTIKPPPHPISPPPPSPPGHHSTIIIVVFVSLGGLFFLALLSVALCYFIKKKKKIKVQETADILKTTDEHLKVKEAIIPGPHGTQTVVLSIEEEDVHIEEEEITKNTERVLGKLGGPHNVIAAADHPQYNSDVNAESSSSSGHLHQQAHQTEY